MLPCESSRHYDRFYLLLGALCLLGGLGFNFLRESRKPLMGMKAFYGST